MQTAYCNVCNRFFLFFLFFLVTCQDSYFTCVASGQCISKNRTCDLARDCSDNSDELLAAGCGNNDLHFFDVDLILSKESLFVCLFDAFYSFIFANLLGGSECLFKSGVLL